MVLVAAAMYDNCCKRLLLFDFLYNFVLSFLLLFLYI